MASRVSYWYGPTSRSVSLASSRRKTLAEPTVGRSVHYVSPGSADGRYLPAHRAAVITEIPADYEDDQRVNLLVFNPTGIHFATSVPHNVTAVGYSWHWPERDDER